MSSKKYSKASSKKKTHSSAFSKKTGKARSKVDISDFEVKAFRRAMEELHALRKAKE